MTAQQKTTAWQLAENSAAAYEQYLVGRFFRRWADRLVRHADISPAQRVLDAGCGTGIVARTASQIIPDTAVVGLDPNEGMLSEARQQDAEQRITWRQGSLESLPFDKASFDTVLMQQVLQFLPERAPALAEIRRVLAPNGKLVIALLRDLAFNPSYATLANALDRHAGSEAGNMMRAPFSGPDATEIRQELAAAGFRQVDIQHDILDVRFPGPIEYLREETSSSPLAEPLGNLDADTSEALASDLESELARYRDSKGLNFPMETYFIRAHCSA